MRTVGIIAEYNPFHTGHEYHIRKAKERSGADFAVVVMSPDFVQRGEPAVFDKYTRTQMALRCGADLVFELPVCYATGSAEFFAEGAVALLDRLGIVDVLCFGAETDDIALFRRAARILADEPEEYKTALREELKKGLTFPQARSAAITLSGITAHHGLAENRSDRNQESLRAKSAFTEFLETPNNILGIEYCKALYKLGSRMQPLALKRMGSNYNSSRMDGMFCSATALREGISDNSVIAYQTDGKHGHGALCREYRLNENAWKRMQKYVPEACQDLFRKKCEMPIYIEDFLPYLQLRLLDTGRYPSQTAASKNRQILSDEIESRFDSFGSSGSLETVLDISPDLADRITKLNFQCIGKSYSEIIGMLKTKQITEARIRRALLHLMLDIRTKDVEQYRTDGTVFYAHVLGFKKNAAPLLHEIKERSTVPLITKTASASKLLEGHAQQMWEQDLYASHLYRSVQAADYDAPFKTEYEHSPVII